MSRVVGLAAASILLVIVGSTVASPTTYRLYGEKELTFARNELTAGKAVVLGLVEGVTEYLPISSTGHLEITQRLLDIGTTPLTKEAADAYVTIIQFGAIFAVLVLYWRRIIEMLRGIIGRSPAGRKLFIALVLAVAPAAIVGVAFDKKIKEHLLRPIPISIAWLAGAAAIVWFGARLHREGASSGRAIEAITNRDALLIGVAQIISLWPGASRSLVTILAALAVGLSLSAAVEFSFLLGLVTLSAATAYDALKHHQVVIDNYGIATPLLGIGVAFIAAFVSVRWLVRYLQRHDLTIFAWYRVAAAAIVLALVGAGRI